MSYDASIDDVPLLAGDLSVPLSGQWTMEATAAGDGGRFSVGQRVTVTVCGASRAGTVISCAGPDMRYAMRVVGGAGDMLREVPDRDYAGFSLDRVVADVLRDAGQTVGDLGPLRDVFLAHWIRAREPASNALHRMIRMFPPDVVLRVGPDGAFSATRLTWDRAGLPLDSERAESMPAEDGVVLYPSSSVCPEPGTAISVLGEWRRVDRVQFTWGDDAPAIRAMVWFRSVATRGDRFRDALGRIVREVQAEYRGPDYRALYLGRVAAAGTKRIDVFMEDPLGRFRHVNNVEVLPGPGAEALWARGTRVLVGWKFGDEQYPFAIPAWSGGGGLVHQAQVFSDYLTYSGPRYRFSGTPSESDRSLVAIDGHLRYRHEHSGGGAPTIAALGGLKDAQFLTGSDRMFEVTMTADSSLPAMTPLFEVTFFEPYLVPPMVIGQVVSPKGAPLAFPVRTATTMVVMLGEIVNPLPKGVYQAVVRTGA